MEATGTARDNNFITEKRDDENIILYIEDDELNRRALVKYFQERNYNLLAPNSIEECVDAIRLAGKLKCAVIDNNLSQWVGKNFEKSIKIDGSECYNGIQLAQAIGSLNYKTQIGLFSSHETDLLKVIKDLPGTRSFKVLLERTGAPNEHIVDFVESSYKLAITAKPLQKIEGDLPIEIQTFYAKKIINSKEPGEYIWKAGNYSWLVGINKDISHRYGEMQELDQRATENSEEKFLICLRKNDFGIESIIDLTFGSEINFNDLTSRVADRETHKSVHDYLFAEAACKKYLKGEVGMSRLLDALSVRGEYAMFEGQKILFKEVPQTLEKQIKSKEEIHELLSGFALRRFHKILDIYKGRVDLIDDHGIAHAKLESFSPEKVVRKEAFRSEFLTNHHVREDSLFEYTIYTPTALGGGGAYHIQPI